VFFSFQEINRINFEFLVEKAEKLTTLNAQGTLV
jgi:hypothetical protein